MNCLSENLIQAYIDGELEAEQSVSVLKHLQTCQSCQTSHERLLANNAFCSQHLKESHQNLDVLMGQNSAGAFSPEDQISNRLKQLYQVKEKPKKGVTPQMKSYQKWLVTAAAVGIIVSGLAFEPVRAAVGDAVSIFRAQSIETVDLSFGDLQKIEQAIQSKAGAIDIENLAKVTQQGGESQSVQPEQAQGLVNFPLSELPGLKSARLESTELTTPQEIEMVLNIKNVNGLMETLGATTLFDASLDEKAISMHMPGVVTQHYSLDNQTGFVRYAQTKLPEISAPEGTQLSDLTHAIASMGILPPDLQSKVLSLSNPSQTLYLPNVDNALEKIILKQPAGQEVFFHVDQDHDETYGYAIWLENGILKTLHGNFDKATLIKWIEGAN